MISADEVLARFGGDGRLSIAIACDAEPSIELSNVAMRFCPRDMVNIC